MTIPQDDESAQANDVVGLRFPGNLVTLIGPAGYPHASRSRRGGRVTDRAGLHILRPRLSDGFVGKPSGLLAVAAELLRWHCHFAPGGSQPSLTHIHRPQGLAIFGEAHCETG